MRNGQLAGEAEGLMFMFVRQIGHCSVRGGTSGGLFKTLVKCPRAVKSNVAVVKTKRKSLIIKKVVFEKLAYR